MAESWCIGEMKGTESRVRRGSNKQKINTLSLNKHYKRGKNNRLLLSLPQKAMDTIRVHFNDIDSFTYLSVQSVSDFVMDLGLQIQYLIHISPVFQTGS